MFGEFFGSGTNKKNKQHIRFSSFFFSFFVCLIKRIKTEKRNLIKLFWGVFFLLLLVC
jgi:hypothetical protein